MTSVTFATHIGRRILQKSTLCSNSPGVKAPIREDFRSTYVVSFLNYRNWTFDGCERRINVVV